MYMIIWFTSITYYVFCVRQMVDRRSGSPSSPLRCIPTLMAFLGCFNLESLTSDGCDWIRSSYLPDVKVESATAVPTGFVWYPTVCFQKGGWFLYFSGTSWWQSRNTFQVFCGGQCFLYQTDHRVMDAIPARFWMSLDPLLVFWTLFRAWVPLAHIVKLCGQLCCVSQQSSAKTR